MQKSGTLAPFITNELELLKQSLLWWVQGRKKNRSGKLVARNNAMREMPDQISISPSSAYTIKATKVMKVIVTGSYNHNLVHGKA